ncbi:uncharacterized protein BDZ83DRAFT_730230 [Colletotrichum acutatum]|uniref:Uncharacterized protein n=1 Tax=Glomerella acutata TaxID=27357 RepID=A0AAD8XFA9_GLOAC|nr:uncharacterized protein BDZ83DRAFT_730230 [Colletotrichum acutatum]KAK1725714.1 hypothetical protein BDZ83DRAFT_730230 [Colletotrichum acutatum]
MSSHRPNSGRADLEFHRGLARRSFDCCEHDRPSAMLYRADATAKWKSRQGVREYRKYLSAHEDDEELPGPDQVQSDGAGVPCATARLCHLEVRIAAAHQEQGLSEDGVIEMGGKRATSWARSDGLRRGMEGKIRAPQDGPDPASFPCFRYLARYWGTFEHVSVAGRFKVCVVVVPGRCDEQEGGKSLVQGTFTLWVGADCN